jgi:hypothetical protein
VFESIGFLVFFAFLQKTTEGSVSWLFLKRLGQWAGVFIAQSAINFVVFD